MYDNFEGRISEESETMEWFQVHSGVKQSCVMSGFLFLPIIDGGSENRITVQVHFGLRATLDFAYGT